MLDDKAIAENPKLQQFLEPNYDNILLLQPMGQSGSKKESSVL